MNDYLDPFRAPGAPPQAPTIPIRQDDPSQPPQQYVLGDPDKPVVVNGWMLGSTTSARLSHGEHMNRGDSFAAQGERCFACRWFEIAILRDSASGMFVVATVGGTIIPNEKTYYKVEYTESAYEVIELLTLRKPGREPNLPMVSARALAQAASRDPEIEHAYANRSVQ